MSEVDQLRARIDKAGPQGVLTSQIRDDYEPAGQMMIRSLTESGEYVQRKGFGNGLDQEWRIFKKGTEPY
ncbi:MAG: hypothetical protein RKH07_12520 [Gammaproteobacteria bacterium]